MPLRSGKANIGYGPPRATGGIVGPLTGNTPGRADKLPLDVPTGAHVIPADVVGALGGGNSMHGHRVLFGMFPGSRMARRAQPRNHIKLMRPPNMADGGETGTVPIRASDGEFIVSPDDVSKVGDGDANKGHAILDRFILNTRNANIQHLKSIPGPSK